MRGTTAIDAHFGVLERMGDARRGPFAKYTDDPLSLFMKKRLAAHSGAALIESFHTSVLRARRNRYKRTRVHSPYLGGTARRGVV